MGKALLKLMVILTLCLSTAVLLGACSRTPGSLEPVEETAIAQLALTRFARTVEAEQTPSPPTPTRPAPTFTPVRPSPTPTQAEPGSPTSITTSAETAPPTATLTPASPTRTATLAPTPTREIIFQENFEATRGWYTFESERYRMQYLQGGYRIYNNITEAAVTSVRTQKHSDVHLEVEAARVSGPQNGYYGLVCRYQDDGNYYAAVVSSDGFYGVARIQGGMLTFISPAPAANTAVKTGFTVNRIEMTCHSNSLSLFVNGNKLVQVKDTTFTEGFIGLVAGTGSIPGLEVKFDNFTVSK
jgi:hypothetical protein